MLNKKRGFLPGIFIIVMGILLLLGNLDLFDHGQDFFWGILFLAGGFISMKEYARDKNKWWFLGLTSLLYFIGLAIIINALNFIDDDIIGTLLFWGLAAVFIHVGQRNEKAWWCYLVAGIAIVLGSIVFLETFNLLEDAYVAFVLFLGFGLTFAYLWLIRNEINKLNWAKYPAIGLITIAFFVLISSTSSILEDMFLPSLLILVGILLIYRSLAKSKSKKTDETKEMEQIVETDNGSNI